MVTKSLKIRLTAILLVCQIVMAIVPTTIQADPVGEVAVKAVPVAVKAAVVVGNAVPQDWSRVAVAWSGAGTEAKNFIGAGCKAFKNVVVSGLGYQTLEVMGNATAAAFKAGTAWFEFFQKHPFVFAMPLGGAALYSAIHKHRHGTWW